MGKVSNNLLPVYSMEPFIFIGCMFFGADPDRIGLLGLLGKPPAV
jgi:hypothetical protein